MRKYRGIIFLIAAVMAAGLAVFIKITGSYHFGRMDAVSMNGIVQTVRENWNEPEALDRMDTGTELMIFDSEDFLVYSSAGMKKTDVSSPEAAVSNGYICLPISENGRFFGTAVIPDPGRTGYDSVRKRLIVASAVLISVLLLLMILYGEYVLRTIIKPFRKMEKFAGRIAGGELDEPLERDRNNMFGAFTESFDIMREELRAARDRENALKIKEKEMVASLSHDLKTPITGIKLICELLSVKISDSYVTEKIGNIHQKAEQINILVSDLLSSALEELGEMNVECSEEPSSVLRELVSEHDVRSLAREGDIPECLLCIDRIRLSQVIGNIISNSYKYADTPIDIAYTVGGNYLEMAVRDYGDGVPEDEISLITTKFYRGKTNSVGKDGNGLGLYISSELMSRMNGELLCSCGEKGMTVTLMIPLA